jgi:hypothetical protein
MLKSTLFGVNDKLNKEINQIKEQQNLEKENIQDLINSITDEL